MPRWITFDQQTFSLLRDKLIPGASIESFARGAIDYALAKPGVVVTLLPSIGADIGLAIFRCPQPRKTIPQPVPVSTMSQSMSQPAAVKAGTRAGGFLGLSDEPVYEEESVPEKKGWWKRFWDE